MTQKIRSIQLFIHRFYDAIKLVMLFVIFLLVILSIFYQLEGNQRASAERGRAILAITKTISSETEKQTETINRQLQALCFLLVETSGEETLRQLDPPLEEQCRDLASELRAAERRVELEQLESSIRERATATPITPRASPVPSPVQTQTPRPTNTPSPTPSPSPQPIQQSIPVVTPLLNIVGGLLDFVGNVVTGR